MKKQILLIALLALMLMPLTLAKPYSESIDKDCINDKCTLTIYSGIKNVFEDGKYKPIEEARSLKDKGVYYIIAYGNDSADPQELIIEDFNYTSIKLRDINIPENVKDKDVLVKHFDKNKNEKVDKRATLSFKRGTGKINYTVNNWDFGDTLHLGDNSTIITLQSNISDNLGDAYIQQSNGNTNYGTQNLLNSVGAIAYGRFFISWNLSAIPYLATVESAYLNLTTSAAYSNSIGIYYVNQTFGYVINETSLTHNNNLYCNGTSGAVLNCGPRVALKTLGNIAGENVSYNITSALNFAMTNNLKNITLMGVLNSTSGDVNFYSKEYSTASVRPKLIITYSDYVDTVKPYFTYIPANTFINYSQGFAVQFNASDNIALDSFFINWSSLFTINKSGYLQNLSANLPVGNYKINVSINDTIGNTNYTIYSVNVACVPLLLNTSWSAWIHNGECTASDNLKNESRYLTQYDLYSCGTYDNETITQYRYTEPCAEIFDTLSVIFIKTLMGVLCLSIMTVSLWSFYYVTRYGNISPEQVLNFGIILLVVTVLICALLIYIGGLLI